MIMNNYVVTTTLPPQFGGRTNALLQRTKHLMNQYGVAFTLISTNYRPNYFRIYESYIERDLVPAQTNFMNIYDFFAGRDYRYKKAKRHPVQLKGYDLQEVRKKQTYRYYQEGELKRFRKYDKETGSLIFEDIMDIHTRLRKIRYEYNEFGYLHRKTIYRSGTLHVLEEIYYNDKGKVYLARQLNGREDREIKRILLFWQNRIKEFKSESDYFEYGFNLMIKDGSATFSDARLLDKALLQCKAKTKKIFVLHSTHRIDGQFRWSFGDLFSRHDEADAIIALTHEQAEDMIQEEGISREVIQVIPHAVGSKRAEVTDRSLKKEIVYVGRLAADKQIDHIIHAFGMMAKEHPEWKLSIYGTGPEEENLNDLIHSLALEGQAVLRGFTEDPHGVFKEAAFSVMASRFEGFGLVILESLANGCPVIAYDFKYGPKDLIQDGQNGILIEKNNIEALAAAMQRLASKPLSGAFLDDAFYLESTTVKWQQLLQDQ